MRLLYHKQVDIKNENENLTVGIYLQIKVELNSGNSKQKICQLKSVSIWNQIILMVLYMHRF